MYINLKDINTNYILSKCEYAKKTYTKDITIKAIEKLKKDSLKVDTSNMHVYRNNQLVERFSLLSDELEDVKNFKDSENKTDWMIKWYFSRYINNETHKLIYN